MRFEDILAQQDPSIFLVNFITNLGEVFGKLYITENEIVFDPLNQKVKGFINQTD